MPYTDVRRDGFAFGLGGFSTESTSGHVERVEPQALRTMFLPKLTSEGKKKLRDHKNFFVPAQLKHYGIDYDEEDLAGQGTVFLKKQLAAGNMDKVPYHIEQLESEMSNKWHNQLTMDEMVETHQEWVIKKYFLDASGHPDRTKMIGVLIVPVPFRSTKRAGKVIDAAKKVNGLHYGRRGDYLCIGWSEAAVEVTVRDDAGRFESEETYISRDEERNLMHTKYLREAKARHTNRDWSPVGSFIIDCDEIEAQWPNDADNMTLDLYKTDLPNVFFARFDFGIHEGVMILSGSKAALQQYCDELERGDDDDDEIQPATGSKSKAKGKGNRSRKKQSAQNEAPGKLFLRWKGAETGTGEILHRAEEGSISFQDAERSVFSGKIDMTYVGRNVSFTARKVSDIPKRGKTSWNDYSFAAYERARKSRWGGSRWI